MTGHSTANYSQSSLGILYRKSAYFYNGLTTSESRPHQVAVGIVCVGRNSPAPTRGYMVILKFLKHQKGRHITGTRHAAQTNRIAQQKAGQLYQQRQKLRHHKAFRIGRFRIV